MTVSAGAIRAGEAYVTIGANDAPLKRKLEQVEARLRKLGQGIQSFGASLAKLGVGLGLPLAVGAKFFGDFEESMARVRALRDPTEEQFSALSKLALKLGADTQFSSKQAADAMIKLAEAGLNVGDIMKATGPVLDLAATAKLEMADAARITSDVLNGMQVPIGGLTKVIDVLAKASTTAANSSIPELGEAFAHFGPIASFAGLELEEVTAAIQVLSKAGIKGEMAGTMLRGMLSSLTSPSKDAIDVMRKYKIEVLDAAGNVKSLVNIIGELEKAFKGMAPGTVLNELGKLFSTRQAGGAAKLLSAGSGEVRERTAALKDSDGTAARIAGVQMDTLKGGVELLLSSLEGLAVTVGQAITPTLRALGSQLVAITGAVSEWAARNGELFAAATRWSVGLIAAGAAFFALGTAIKAASFALGGFAVAATAIKAAVIVYMTNPIIFALKWIGPLAYSLVGLSGSLGLATVAAVGFAGAFALMKTLSATATVVLTLKTAVLALGAALSAVAAAPLLGVVAAGAAGLATLAATSTTALQGFRGLGAGLAEIGDGIIGTFRSIAENARTSIAGISDAIAGGDLEMAFRIAGLGVKAAAEEMWANLKAGAQNQLTLIGAGTVKTFLDMVLSIQKAFTHIGEFIGNAWDVLLVKLQQGWNELVGYAKKAWVEVTTLSTSKAAEKRAEIDKETDRRNAELEAGAGASIGARGEAARKTRERLDAHMGGIKDQIDADAAREIGARNARAKDASADTRSQIDTLSARARAAREAREYEEWLESLNRDTGAVDIQKKIPDVAAGLGQAETMAASLGTTSDRALGMLGAGPSVADRIAQATQQTAENTKKIADGKGGIVVK